MTKEVKKLLLVIWMTVVAVCCLPTITVAEEGAAKSDEREEMISDAVLPVAVGYRNDSGEVSYYLNGTSFLINEQAVLTNKHVAVPDEILLEKIMEEHALNELPEKDERLGIYVMTGKNMFVPAKIHASVQSDRMDFAVLQLSSKLYDRERLTLGEGVPPEEGNPIMFVGCSGEGYREMILEKIPQISERGEVIRLSESEEVPDGENDKVIEHNIPLYGAGAGSPLLNANREVVGINVFQEGMVPYAVQIYHIRKALDTFEIPYKKPEAMAEGEKQTEKHTEQAEKERKRFSKKIDSLENRENQNGGETGRTGVMLAVFGGIAGIGGMAAMIWMSVHTNQKKHAEENGARMQHTYQQMQTSKGQVRQVDGRTETRYSPGRRKREEEREWNMEEYMMASEGVGETTLLNAAGGETTVLHNAEFAYLLRKDTGERILINTQPFLIGKEQRKVNYCIRDNTSVSRCHAKISKQGWQYYIEDQNSTNGTYVEGKALHPYQETALSDNVTIRLSDEVFEFHFM